MTDLVAVAKKAAEGISARRRCRTHLKPGKRIWHHRVVNFHRGQEEQAVSALVLSARRERFARFLVPADSAVAKVAVVRSRGAVVRACAQYSIGRDEMLLRLDFFGARA